MFLETAGALDSSALPEKSKIIEKREEEEPAILLGLPSVARSLTFEIRGVATAA